MFLNLAKLGAKYNRLKIAFSILVLAILLGSMAWGGIAGNVQAAHPSPIGTVPTGPTSAARPSQGNTPALTSIPHVFPPRKLAIGTCPNAGAGPVVPNCAYAAEAAPMGIGDFGVSGSTYYSYSTTKFLGVFSYTTLDIYNNSLSSDKRYFTVQLNVVLNFINGGKNYSYWIQDVAVPEDTAQNKVKMSYEDNIWNFSSTSPGTLTGLKGNGSASGTGSNSYYYDGATGTGSSDTLNAPNSFELLVVSSQNSQGVPMVAFEYKDPTLSSFVTYDNVTFSDFTKVTTDRNFLVDGYDMNPIGLFEDAELTIGGPGGGAYTITQPTTDAHESLYFRNGDNFQAVRAAWNLGSDTAESTSSDQSIFSNDGVGTPLDTELNGTTKDAKPLQSYTESQVGFVKTTANCAITDGVFAVDSKDTGFNGTWANVTLVPGTYDMWMNSTNASDSLGSVTVGAGSYQSLSATSLCGGGGGGPVVTTPAPSVSSVDAGQTVTFTTTLSQPGSGGVTYSWTPSSSSLNCANSTSTTYTCAPTSAGASYTVSVTAKDSSGKTDTVVSSPFTVYSDPSVTVAASSTSVDMGKSTTLTATVSGGSGGFSYTWAGLPTGCSSSSVASLPCTPTATGTFLASVTVKDSNGLSASSSTVSITVNVDPTVTASASTTSLDIGQTTTFTATVSGGSGGISYTWSGLPAGCISSSVVSLSCTPTGAGSSSVSVSVTDSSGYSASSTPFSVTVYSDPSTSTPTASVQSATIKESVTFTTNASGGTGTYLSYSWTGLSSSECGNLTGSAVTCDFTSAGTLSIIVSVKDSNGFVSPASSALSFQVYPALSSVAISPTSATIFVDGSQVFSATPSCSGGQCPSGTAYTWTLSSSAATLNSSSGRSVTLNAGPSGADLTLTVSVTLGATTQTSSDTIEIIPSLSSVSITPGSLSLAEGASQTFRAEPACVGGSCPAGVTYVWSLSNDLGSIGTASSNTTTFVAGDGVGNITLSLTAKLNGVTQQSSITISITHAASSTSPFGSLPDQFTLGLILALVAVGVVVAVLVRRKGKKENAADQQAQQGPWTMPPQQQTPPWK